MTKTQHKILKKSLADQVLSDDQKVELNMISSDPALLMEAVVQAPDTVALAAGGFGGFEDIFESFFGGASRRRGPAEINGYSETSIRIEFEEAAFGVKKDITINRYESCDALAREPVQKKVQGNVPALHAAVAGKFDVQWEAF